ncbi:MAG: hypothetical protein LN416_04890 [Candidatus Thermoplasmatota archaeon]|nr:hypothetical protein [Candidatus Thermoplasmatota archaeon]
MSGPETKDYLRIPRGKLAILYEATLPYREEKCYMKIASGHVRFSSLSRLFALEYHVSRMKQPDITRMESTSRFSGRDFITDSRTLNILLAPFSKPLSGERAKKSGSIVFLEFVGSRCRFVQRSPKFVGDWLDLRGEEEDLWHELPETSTKEALEGVFFKEALDRISSTRESNISVLAEEDGLHLGSQAGKEWVGSVSHIRHGFSMGLPRVSLQKVCRLLAESFDEFWVSIAPKHLILFGGDEDHKFKTFISGLE